MPKGKKYPDDIKEKAYAIYSASGNYRETAKAVGVPYSTVKGWIDKKPKDELDKLRDENKKACARIAGRAVESFMLLLEKRANTALKNEEAIESLISEIAKSPDSEVPEGVKKNVIDKLRKIQVSNIKDVAIAMGTTYDKYVAMNREVEDVDKEETGVVVMPEVKINGAP